MRYKFFSLLCFVGALLSGCSGQNAKPEYVLDIICPDGYSAPPSTATTEYYCLSRIPVDTYYEQNCPANKYFCPLLEAKRSSEASSSSLPPITSSSVTISHSSLSSSASSIIYYDLLCPLGFSAPADDGMYDYFCVSTISAESYYADICNHSPSGDRFFCEELHTQYIQTGFSSVSGSSSSMAPVAAWDIVCPEGFDTPPATEVASYFCVSREPADAYYANRCDGPSEALFCAELHAIYGQSSSSSGASSSAEGIAGYFADYPCGVDYNALGNGSWQACMTFEDGTAGCVHGDQPTEVVKLKWSDGSDVTNAQQVSGAGYFDVVLVTDAGDTYFGGRTSLDKNSPLFSGVGISGTGGQNTRCAMIRDGDKNDVRCWQNNSDPYRPELPADFNAMQLSANYSDVCALDDDGAVWCWEQKPDNSLDFIDSTPSKAPFSEEIVHVSVGQLSVCGVKYSGGVECLARWDSTTFLPNKGSATDEPVEQPMMYDVVAMQIGFGQGLAVDYGGQARLWKDGLPRLFGTQNAVAAAGDRGAACVLTRFGEIDCMRKDYTTARITQDVKAANPVCPF